MFLSNGNYTQSQIAAIIRSSSITTLSAPNNARVNSNMNMIGRIHLVKPGCGSCGK